MRHFWFVVVTVFMNDLMDWDVGVMVGTLTGYFGYWLVDHVDGTVRKRREAFILQYLAAHGEAKAVDMVRASGGILWWFTIYAVLHSMVARNALEFRGADWSDRFFSLPD